MPARLAASFTTSHSTFGVMLSPHTLPDLLIERNTVPSVISEAWISGYESLIPRMTNDEKDRHVVAAAVHSEAAIILTLNLRHFRPEHLVTWGVRALHPQSFLIEIFQQEQAVVLTKLDQQATDRGRGLSQLLDILNATVPDLVAVVSAAISRK